MKTTIRVAALLTAVSMVSGCTSGLRHRDRQSGALRLPTAPTLDPSPTDTGAVGSPAPKANSTPMMPASSPFDAG
jgi:hypothetical protein